MARFVDKKSDVAHGDGDKEATSPNSDDPGKHDVAKQ
jgi:hypothetical protein